MRLLKEGIRRRLEDGKLGAYVAEDAATFSPRQSAFVPLIAARMSAYFDYMTPVCHHDQ